MKAPQNRVGSGVVVTVDDVVVFDGRAVEVSIPMKTRPVTNSREHHMAKHRLAKKEVEAVQLYLLVAGWPERRLRAAFADGCLVTFTRVSRGELDDDNLPSAFKAIRDGIAKLLGRDDSPREKRVRWAYAQMKGAPGIRIRI